MNKQFKRITALALTFIMLFSMLPIDALAALLITTDVSEGVSVRSMIPVPTDPPVYTRTYTFMVEGQTEAVDTQIIKTGEYLTEPQAQQKPNHRFVGWFVGEEKLLFGPSNPISFTGPSAELTATARFEPIYYVFFMDSATATANVIRTKSGVTGAQIPTGDVTLPLSSTQAVTGWYTDQSLTGDPVGDNFTVGTANQQLWPKIEAGNYIYFVSGNQGTYIPPKFVPPLVGTQAPTAPTRPGYSFLHWSETENGPAYTFGQPITAATTLYAVWQPNASTRYTVVFWKQSINDNKNAADSAKTYDYAKSEERYAATESMVSPTAADGSQNYTGFHYNAGKSVPVQVKGDATTVLNVYYDRNRLTINYYEKVSNVWKIDNTMDGLYQQTLAQNGYAWPNGKLWYEYIGNTQYSRLTFLDAFIFDNLNATQTTYPKDTLSLRNMGTETGNYYIRHYKQNLDGSYPTEANNTNRAGNGSFGFSNKYNGFTVKYYRIGEQNSWVETSPGASVNYGYNNLYMVCPQSLYQLVS